MSASLWPSLDPETTPERPIPVRTTPQGWTVLRLHWSIIPDYDYTAACRGLTTEQIRQELEIDWTASSHKRVFPSFSEIHIAREPLPFYPDRPLICGWDIGISNTPAWAPSQVYPTGQWALFRPLVGPPNRATGIYEFGQDVAEHLLRHYAEPHGLTLADLNLVHFGDPAGNTRPVRTQVKSDDRLELRSAYEILNRGVQIEDYDEQNRPVVRNLPGWGWRVKPGAVGIPERLEAVRARINMLIDGRPALIVCPTATELIQGFMGQYHYKQRVDGTYSDDINKNWWSHPLDAVQYAATRLFATRPVKEEEEDEDAVLRHDGFRSHAANRRYR